MYGLACHLHIESLLAESASAAILTNSLAGISTEHIFILYLVAVGFNPLEEFVQAYDGLLFSLRSIALPYKVLDLLTQVAVWLKDRNTVFDRILDKSVFEPSHLFTPPARDCSVIYALALVRHHQIFADSDYLAEAPAHRAGAKRAVETEHIFIRTDELHSVSLESVDELLHLNRSVGIFPADEERAVSFIECAVNRSVKSCLEVFVCTRQFETVHKQVEFLRIITGLCLLHHLLDSHHPIGKKSRVSLLLQLKHKLHLVLSVLPSEISKQIYRARLNLKDMLHNIIYSMASDLFAADRRISPSYTGIDHPEIIEYLCACSDG